MTFTEPSGAGALPGPEGFDLLVIMGGPMNVYEHDQYPWLADEKDFIRAGISGGKMVLGICLGAQLVADVLGGEVTRAPFEEIGWYPVELTEAGRRLEVFAHFPDRFTTLQWHGDTFSIPPGAVHAASSEAVPNQAFGFDDGRVIGLQFHLEETRETLGVLVEVAGGGLPSAPDSPRGPWVSRAEDLLAPDVPFGACRELLFGLLDRMAMR
jgi:GMP synthase (glutamine-hydrolysing)